MSRDERDYRDDTRTELMIIFIRSKGSKERFLPSYGLGESLVIRGADIMDQEIPLLGS